MRLDIDKALQNYKGNRKELAEELGVNVQWLSNVKRPDMFPKQYKVLHKLSELTRIKIEELIIKD